MGYAICSLVATTVMTTVIGIMIARLDKKFDKDRNDRISRDFNLYNGVDASLKLGITMAKELKKDKEVNGNTSEALDYAEKKKHELNDFYIRQATENLNKG